MKWNEIENSSYTLWHFTQKIWRVLCLGVSAADKIFQRAHVCSAETGSWWISMDMDSAQRIQLLVNRCDLFLFDEVDKKSMRETIVGGRLLIDNFIKRRHSLRWICARICLQFIRVNQLPFLSLAFLFPRVVFVTENTRSAGCLRFCCGK